MNRKDFLDQLERHLRGALPDAKVREHIAFYNDYINTEIGRGRREEDILAELGDPRLIAKNILDTPGESYTNVYETTEEDYRSNNTRQKPVNLKIHGIVALLITLLVFIVIIALVIAIVIGLVKIFLYIILPVIIIGAVILFISGLFKR